MFRKSFLFVFLAFLFIEIMSPELSAQDSSLNPYKLYFEKPNEISQIEYDEKSNLNLSNAHYHFGEKSLHWKFENNSFLKIKNFKILDEENSPLAYGDYFPNSPTTVLSIYSEKKQEGFLKISYGTIDEDEVWFNLPLNFTGWRTVWVPFYEMQGNAPKRNTQIKYTTFKITPQNIAKGSIYLDDIVFSQYQDDRYAYPDFLVPFIKTEFAPEQDHWMPSLVYYEYIRQLNIEPISSNIIKELSIIEEKLEHRLETKDTISNVLDTVAKEYNKLDLKVGKTVKGRPLTFRNSETYFDETPEYDVEYMEVHRFGEILLKIAQLYGIANTNEKSRIAKNFNNATRYFLDQGWQAGSSGGTRHHIGYSLEDLAMAFFIMRKPLREANLLDEVGDSMQWVFNLGKILAPEENFVANIDYFNTQSFYHLMIIYMRNDPAAIAQLLKSYSNYMSITLAQDKEHGVFKKDGTSWHHGGHYPAYGMGAFKNLPKVFRTLAGTQFQINTAGHENFKKALLTTRLYSNKYDFGFGNAGRHPLEDNSIYFLRKQFLDMIYAGNPEHTDSIDFDFAKAYLRLWGEQDSNVSALKNKFSLSAEELPGYHIMPYAATAIHRRDNWAAIIKGYSKYVWASEIYIASNRYGRYPANGTIQILDENGEKQNGFNQNGWNWNRYPGATIINLPLEELESDLSLLMFKSNQTFAGAVKQDDNGVFAMILDESKGSNSDGQKGAYGFPGKLKARKSIFSFGDKLICLGSNISSVDEKHEVETVLFQNNLDYSTNKIFSSSTGIISEYPFKNKWEANEATGWLIDAYSNAYHVISDNSIEVKQEEQVSYHNKYSINTGKMNPKGNGVKHTSGDYASAWINHGKSPENGNYQYIIYPKINDIQKQAIISGSYIDDSYKILQNNKDAHIVKDITNKTTGYVVFKAKSPLKSGLLQSVSLPALLMIKKHSNDQIELSLTQPDLNFYNKEGNFTPGASHPLKIEIKLEGIWRFKTDRLHKDIKHTNGNTILKLIPANGFPNKNLLIRG